MLLLGSGNLSVWRAPEVHLAPSDNPSTPQKRDSPAVMSNDIVSNLQRVRQLREHGRYADAVGELEELLKRFGRDVELAVELGETLFIQGYFGRATKVLEEHLAHCERRNNLTAAAGEIICYFARFFETSQFKESLHHAEKLYNGFSSGENSGVVNDATVRLFSSRS